MTHGHVCEIPGEGRESRYVIKSSTRPAGFQQSAGSIMPRPQKVSNARMTSLRGFMKRGGSVRAVLDSLQVATLHTCCFLLLKGCVKLGAILAPFVLNVNFQVLSTLQSPDTRDVDRTVNRESESVVNL